MERPAADPARHPATGVFYLGACHLEHRGTGVLADWPAGARRGLCDLRRRLEPRLACGWTCQSHGDRRALHLGISGHLSAALADPGRAPRRPVSELAPAIPRILLGPRGVVTLAAALSIPFSLDGQAFPDRDILLFTAFCVIAVTLIVLGAALPIVVRLLGLTRAGEQEAAADKRDERRVRLEGIDAVLRELDTLPRGAQPFARETIRRLHSDRRANLIVTADESNEDDPVAEASRLQLDLIDVERASIARAFADNRLTDEARRRIERELDLDEARIRHALASTSLQGGDPAD